VLEVEGHPANGWVEHPQRLVEQLLSGLVPLEDDNSRRVRHRALNLSRGPNTNASEAPSSCTWCGNRVEHSDGYRVSRVGSRGEAEQEVDVHRCATFCRLEHVVPWIMQGAHWEAAEPLEPHDLGHEAQCTHCGAALEEAHLVLVRHRGVHRIPDGFCSTGHLLEWAKAGGRFRS